MLTRYPHVYINIPISSITTRNKITGDVPHREGTGGFTILSTTKYERVFEHPVAEHDVPYYDSAHHYVVQDKNVRNLIDIIYSLNSKWHVMHSKVMYNIGYDYYARSCCIHIPLHDYYK